MPPQQAHNDEIIDDWEEFDAPFSLSQEDLGRLKLLFHDDDLREAWTLLHQRRSQLCVTGDAIVATTLALVLSNCEQTTHALAMVHDERRDMVAEMDALREAQAAMEELESTRRERASMVQEIRRLR
jgi:hypothetical protein